MSGARREFREKTTLIDKISMPISRLFRFPTLVLFVVLATTLPTACGSTDDDGSPESRRIEPRRERKGRSSSQGRQRWLDREPERRAVRSTSACGESAVHAPSGHRLSHGQGQLRLHRGSLEVLRDRWRVGSRWFRRRERSG